MSETENPTQARRARVLIVENDPDKREEVQSMVELWGYQAIVAGGAGDQLLYEAKRLARQKKCHLAITDLRVGDDSDIEDYGGLAVKADSPYLRVILFSGFADWVYCAPM